MCLRCYKAAGEEARYKILLLLKHEPMRVADLTDDLQLTQPTVTHHLKTLSGAGLIRMEKHGREHVYALDAASACYDECGLLKGLKS